MSIANVYENRARKLLEAKGFKVQRSSRSEFPDLHYQGTWVTGYVEVKKAKNAHSLRNAKSTFRVEARKVAWYRDAVVQLWVWYQPDGEWYIYDWIDGQLERKGTA